ncbi:ATP-binding protein [Streptomyces sp. MUSC 14]|uniref:ATP-binding protein n=1 Tax=Streptomyces sp. MUSC 14 TaxID=1354889 RepID=UPI0008F58461|nr:ATP-binding protein [Streptomyces sp. MUSC 14]OIK02560.1 ATP-binding protein [Streptomyces sp. MUSC 14]
MTPAATAVTVASDLMQQTSRGFAVAFTPDKARVGRMRRITAAHLRLWHVSEPTAESVVLAVSELVTNAIRHGRGDVGLKILYADNDVRVEVTDGNPKPATLTNAQSDDTSGRGLFLVAVLARDWGVSDDGEMTWCVFNAPAGRS